jgi:hypothetical protein
MGTTMDEAYVIVVTNHPFVVLEECVQNPTGKAHNLGRANSKSNQSILVCQERKCKMSLNPLCTIIVSPLPKGSYNLHGGEGD